EIDAPVEHNLEQQVLGGSIGLDVIDEQVEAVLLQSVWGVVDVGEVGRRDLEDPEARIHVLRVLADELPSATDTLLGDVRDGGKTGLCGGGVIGDLLIELHHDEAPPPTIKRVLCQHGVRGRSGTGEEVRDNIVAGGHHADDV